MFRGRRYEDVAESFAEIGFSRIETLAVVACISIAVAGAAYWLLQGVPSFLSNSSMDASVPSEVSGTLYYTIGPSTPASALDGTYHRVVTSEERGPLSLIENETTFFPSLTEGVAAGLFYDRDGGRNIKVIERVNGKVLLSRPLENARVGSVALSSNTAFVAYTILRSPLSASMSDTHPGGWRLLVSSVEEGGAFALSGMHPVFSSDGGHLFYIGADGVYAIGLPTNNTQGVRRVWDLDEMVPYASMRLSAGGPHLALSNPSASEGVGSVQVFTIGSGGDLTSVQDFRMRASNIALSADGAYIAVQVRERDGLILPGAGEVTIYQVADGSVAASFPLTSYDSRLNLSTWAQ